MAFDQNAIPTGLRPLNVARTLVEDPHLTPVATSGRNPQRFTPQHPCDIASADTVPVPAKGNVSDIGFVELGYGNVVAGVSAWCPRMPPPFAHTATIPAVGFGYCSDLNVMGNRGGANAVELASSCMTVGINHNTKLSHRFGGGGLEFVSNNISMGSGDSANLCNKVTANGDQISSDSTSGFSSHLRNSVDGNAVDQVSEEGGDGSISKKKVKFMCSFGGKIFPRPSDGMLRYIGGQTRIISVRRDVTFNELVRKMVDTCGQAVVIKYQLPDEDLDALISVSCPDDLDNMMDEYEKLVERSSDGSAKLRMFLFSASELDSSGMVQFGDLHDSGQRYVETVNGMFDGVGGRITRKESFASATSTQNSDLSGTEAVDITNNDLGGVVSGPPSTTLSLPGGDLGTAVAIGPGLVKVDPVSAVFVDASAVSSSIPAVNSVPPEASSQPEAELGRSVPVTLMQQQPGIDFPPPVSQLQPTGDPRQAACVDFVQFRPQLGFSNSHHLGASGSMFIQQPNTLGMTPHQFVPAVHMTMAPASSHLSIMPNTYQSLVQYPRSQMEYFSNASTFGPRFVQLSAEQGYNSLQVPAPPVSVGVGFGLHQVPQSDQTVTSDELVSHHQATFSEKIERLDGCHFCQKAVPHAHSNSALQDQRENLTNPVSDSKFSYYSHHPEDHLTAHPMKNITETGALRQQTTEHGVGMQTRIFNPMDPEVEKPSVEAISFPHHIEGQHENDNTLKDQHNLDHGRISTRQGALGRQGDIRSPHVAVVEQICQSGEVGTLQHHVAVENQFRPNLVLDKHDICFVGAPILASEYNTHENPNEYSNSHHGIIPNQNATHTGICYDHLRPIVGNLENLSICPTDICANLDHCKSPIERTRKEDNFGSCPQPVSEREVLLDNNFVKPMVVLDPNNVKPTTFACSSSEVPYLMNERPVESSEVAQPPVRGSPRTLPQAENGMQHLESNEVCHSRNPHLFDMKTEHINNEVPVSAEWKEDTSLLETRMVSGDVESVSLPIRTGNMQDTANSLFSNQDPWNLQHDAHLLPPRPTKIQPRNEALATREPLTECPFRNIGELNVETILDDGVCHPLVNSNKGSSEEQIRKDLQAVAEGVAASVLQSAQSSSSELHERIDPVCETITEGDVQNNDDGGTRHSEKPNLSFPMSEGFGRLQVIKNSDLEELRELGSGTFGTVYHGKWRGTDVAIKRVNDRCFAGKPSEQDRMREDFWNEAIKLADLHHPNVVAFYGVVLDGPGGSVATVTEYMVNGSLRNALLKNERSLDKRKRLLIAMDAAFGMEYLHRKNIVHFDLKSDNLLVNLRDPHRPICKVGDLGLSKVKRQTLISGGVRGTLPWMAPELLNGSSNMVSEKVDVFSFGIVLWELLTGEEPYANLHYGIIIGGIVSNTLRPEVPESCDPDWRSLMERCWSSEPSERPSFTEIANELRSMATKFPPKIPNQPQ